MTETTPSAPNKAVNLALQGGGAHGAFTWGVLDHLLEDGRVSIEGVSGTSSGALNAVMLADGLARGGPAEARNWERSEVCGSIIKELPCRVPYRQSKPSRVSA